jgi:hypothetical protein
MIVLTATGAHAEDWCGYAAHAKSVVECGYSTVADCETAIGKGGMCFVDPEIAFNTKLAAPLSRPAATSVPRDSANTSTAPFEARFVRTPG